MKILLEKGADSNIVPASGKSLIEIILETRNPEILKSFLKSKVAFKSSETILHSLARLNAETLDEIKYKKLPENNKNGLTPSHVVRMLIQKGVDVNLKTKRGKTALHLASAEGSLELVKALVQHGAAVNSLNDRGTSALMVACAKSKENIVTFLLYNGANPKIKDEEGRTPLHYAAEGGCVGLVTALLSAGARIDDQDNKGVKHQHLSQP
ncbi:26S proteasome non-ATPase regulatory subunit 10-like [Halyomorpha halys]|uniref:26S proteasome non-ATPase regulatory subunit 10-like n=1 Tax=Halyomorpha halys TaxID=286706 RepID=UPI0006D4EB87|nr:uncharacterized protein LOC106681427 [Halyomorpha halys]